MRFIEAHAEEPFFCYIATNAPHGPLNVEDKYVEKYRAVTPHENRTRFYGMIENIDENVGLLEAKLAELGISDDTILVFMTDNGTASGIDLDARGFPIDGPGSYNAGMRGMKCSPYEGGHRVPFLIRYQNGGVFGGADCDSLTSYVDFMPTVIDLCGVTIAENRSFHGRSLVPLMKGDSDQGWNERIIVSDTQRISRPMKWRKSTRMWFNPCGRVMTNGGKS
jgi:arylsulfatase A-like enzyme